MDISIIIPHYNLEPKLLRRALVSVIQQFYTMDAAWEIIIVDDGSDSSPEPALQDLPCEHIRLVRQEHRKQGAARNRGMEEATGEYLLFVDADDYLIPGTLPVLLRMALQQRPDILRFRMKETVGDDLRKTRTRMGAGASFSKRMTGEEYMLHRRLKDAPILYLFKRELAMSHGIRFPEGAYLEDCIFTYRLHHAAQTLMTSDVTAYAYYQRPGSTTHLPTKAHARELRNNHWGCLMDIRKLIADEEGKADTRGLQSKCAFLTCDYLNRICHDLAWHDICHDELTRLREAGLYPLPTHHDYGCKYSMFRLLTNQEWGLRLIQLLIWRRRPLTD